MTNNEQIHGHTIIERISAHPAGVNRGEFVAQVEKEFGANALFYTCSEQGMGLPRLLEFLKERNKVREEGGSLYPGSSPACNH